MEAWNMSADAHGDKRRDVRHLQEEQTKAGGDVSASFNIRKTIPRSDQSNKHAPKQLDLSSLLRIRNRRVINAPPNKTHAERRPIPEGYRDTPNFYEPYAASRVCTESTLPVRARRVPLLEEEIVGRVEVSIRGDVAVTHRQCFAFDCMDEKTLKEHEDRLSHGYEARGIGRLHVRHKDPADSIARTARFQSPQDKI